jgi:tetratricopeptide (TPR) repeat protein
MGSVLRDLGDLPGSIAAHNRALEIYKTYGGPDSYPIAPTLTYLGAALYRRGSLREAKNYLERSIAIYESRRGSEYFFMAHSWKQLGIVLAELGDHSAAVSAFHRARRIFETKVQTGHPDLDLVHQRIRALEDQPNSSTESEA